MQNSSEELMMMSFLRAMLVLAGINRLKRLLYRDELNKKRDSSKNAEETSSISNS
jgi:hypothetical protein